MSRTTCRFVAAATLLAMLGACGGGDQAGFAPTGTAIHTETEAAAHTAPAARKKASLRFKLLDLGVVGQSHDLNSNGDVVGSSATGPFVYRDSELRVLDSSACISHANGINDKGLVAGTGPAGAVTYAGGECKELGTLGGATSAALDISKGGHVTGWSYLAGNTELRAFLYHNGMMHDLGTLGGPSEGRGVNDDGEVTGRSNGHAFLYRRGRMVDLGTLGGLSSEGNDINNKGEVTGRSQLGPCAPPICFVPIHHAFLYSDGVMRDIDTLNSWQSEGLGINNHGQVVGWSTDNDQFERFRAFLYADGVMHNLNDLLDESGAGWTLAYARSINDLGQITGAGFRNKQPFDGQLHAFLLTPLK